MAMDVQVPGGPAEQTGMIEIGDAVCAVDDVDVYGQPLCELGKHVLGPSGSVRALQSGLAAEHAACACHNSTLSCVV
eukprot:2050244-Rhodomonas_salina.1